MHANAEAVFDPPAHPTVTIDLSSFHPETLRSLAYAAMRRVLKMRDAQRINPNVVIQRQIEDLGFIIESLEQLLGNRVMQQIFRNIGYQNQPWNHP